MSSTNSDAAPSDDVTTSRQQQIPLAITSMTTEPVREGLTEYCPMEGMTTIVQNANKPQYAHINRRVESFDSWAYSHIQSPIKLAEAGFYYTGADDRVRCFSCNGGLCNWEAQDVPWFEHSKWFTKCRYLIACKKNDAVSKIINSVVQTTPAKKHPSRSIRVEDISQTFGVNLNLDFSKDLPTKRGWEKGRTSIVVQERDSNQAPQESTDAPGDASAHPAEPDAALPGGQASRESAVQTSAMADTSGIVSASGGTDSVSVDTDAEESGCKTKEEANKNDKTASTYTPRKSPQPSLMEENEALRSRKTCKVCKEKEVCIVLLPCGHLVCCLECSMQIESCPKSCGKIKGTVKVVPAC